MPRRRVGASKHLKRMPTNGGRDPVGHGVGHRTGDPDRVGVLGLVAAVAVAVLEVQPQVLDRLARAAWRRPARPPARRGSESRPSSPHSAVDPAVLLHQARAPRRPTAAAAPGCSGRPARTRCGRAGGGRPRRGRPAARKASVSASVVVDRAPGSPPSRRGLGHAHFTSSYAGRVRKSVKSSLRQRSADQLAWPAGSTARTARRRPRLRSRSDLLVEEPGHELAGDRLAGVGELHLVADLLPHLRSGDLRGGGVLHQVVDGDRAVARQPDRGVGDGDVQVVPQALLRCWRRRPELTSSSWSAVTSTSSRCRSSWLGSSPEHGVEDLAADRDQVGVGDPGAVEAVAGLAGLVGPDLGERGRVDLGVACGWG